ETLQSRASLATSTAKLLGVRARFAGAEISAWCRPTPVVPWVRCDPLRSSSATLARAAHPWIPTPRLMEFVIAVVAKCRGNQRDREHGVRSQPLAHYPTVLGRPRIRRQPPTRTAPPTVPSGNYETCRG